MANKNIAVQEKAGIYTDRLEKIMRQRRHAPFYPRFWPERLAEMQRGIDSLDYETYIRRKPKGIFVCDMGELFGQWLPDKWIAEVLEAIGDDCNSMHRFYLLTKQPQNLIKFSPFPPNCYVGVSVTRNHQLADALKYLKQIQAKVKYFSFEPLLGFIHAKDLFQWINGANWLIIGALTGSKQELLDTVDRIEAGRKESQFTLMPYGNKWTLQPPIEWVEEIMRAADNAGVPVFLKDNLRNHLMRDDLAGYIKEPFANPMFGWKLRQEMPG